MRTGTPPISQPAGNTVRLESLVRSDSLPAMLELARNIPALAPFIHNLVQIRLVLDANIVQGELRWRLGRRHKPAARSSLHEAIAAGVVIPFAPTFLDEEIEKHEGRIADETGTSGAAVRREWQDFRALLHFYKPSKQRPRRSAVIDADDLPYIAACAELGATAVYSRDRHFQRMNAPVICIALDTTLRDYARASSVQIAVAIGSTVTLTVSIEAIVAACRAVKCAVAWFERLNPAVQIAIVAAVVVALAHPTCREKLSSAWTTIKELAGPSLLPLIADAVSQFDAAMKIADAAADDIQRELPSRPKRSALMHARVVCMMARQSLSIPEIERRILAEGYATRAHNFRGYLRRALRTSGQFVELSPGTWALKNQAHNSG